MTISTSANIKASRQSVWEIITDFDNAADNINAIISLEVLEKPEDGWSGFKWRETRKMFGKESTETMAISDYKDGFWYQTTANNHGTIYKSKMEITEISPDECELSMSFGHEPQTLGAKIMSVFSFMFTGAIKKAFQEDLAGIKKIAEA